MLRAIAIGLCVGCAGVPGEVTEVSEQATEADAGADADADAGSEPERCDWFVYWLTTINTPRECRWGMMSHNPSAALFRSQGGECLSEVSCKGLVLCADITSVRERQLIEVWGPAGRDADSVWGVTETFPCE